MDQEQSVLSTPSPLGRSWVASINPPSEAGLTHGEEGEASVDSWSQQRLEGGSWRGVGRQDGGVQWGKVSILPQSQRFLCTGQPFLDIQRYFCCFHNEVHSTSLLTFIIIFGYQHSFTTPSSHSETKEKSSVGADLPKFLAWCWNQCMQ